MAFFFLSTMKKIFCLLAFLAIHICNGYSQDNSTLSEIRLLMGNYEYKKALSLISKQNDDPEFLFQKAVCHKALGDYKQAREVLAKLVECFPDNKTFLGELALAHQAETNWKSSLDCFERLISLDSTNVYFQLKKAEMLYNLDKFEESISLNKKLYIKDNVQTVLWLIGRSYENINQLDSASVYYRRAWQYNFYDTRSLAYLVKASTVLNKIGEAIEACKAYVSIDSTNQQINRLYASAYYLADEYGKAIALFQKCKQNGDTSLIVNRSLGLSYFEIKNSDSAYVYLQKAYVQDTTNNKVMFSLATTCNDIQKGKEALFYFGKYLSRIIPPDATLCQAYKGVAQGYRNEKQFDKSIDLYKFAQNYATENQQALINYTIGEIYIYELENKSKALPYYKLYNAYLKDYIAKKKAKADSDPIEIKRAEVQYEMLEKYISGFDKKK
jgi:tetratricopeptide (TPR) repeat protein